LELQAGQEGGLQLLGARDKMLFHQTMSYHRNSHLRKKVGQLCDYKLNTDKYQNPTPHRDLYQ